jgi:hypothetical protein
MSLKTVAFYIPFSDEAIVDGHLGSPEDQAAAAVRIQDRQREARARWLARPLYQRLLNRVRYSRWRHELPWRFRHAARALRGIECDAYD